MLHLVLSLNCLLRVSLEALDKIIKNIFLFLNSNLDGILNILSARVMKGVLFTWVKLLAASVSSASCTTKFSATYVTYQEQAQIIL